MPLRGQTVRQRHNVSTCPFVVLPPTKEEVKRLPAFVCLLARLLKNASMDLNEMLRVDICWDMDELINF